MCIATYSLRNSGIRLNVVDCNLIRLASIPVWFSSSSGVWFHLPFFMPILIPLDLLFINFRVSILYVRPQRLSYAISSHSLLGYLENGWIHSTAVLKLCRYSFTCWVLMNENIPLRNDNLLNKLKIVNSYLIHSSYVCSVRFIFVLLAFVLFEPEVNM